MPIARFKDLPGLTKAYLDEHLRAACSRITFADIADAELLVRARVAKWRPLHEAPGKSSTCVAERNSWKGTLKTVP